MQTFKQIAVFTNLLAIDLGPASILHLSRPVGKNLSSNALSDTNVLEADDYIQNINRLAPTRVVLLNRVIVGNPEKRLHNAIYRTAPLAGCHSVRLFFSNFNLKGSVTLSGYW